MALFFLLPMLAYLVPYLRGGNLLLWEDGLMYSYPMRWFVHQAYAEGFSPQWMPYAGCGFSLLAEGQTGLCTPWVQMFLPPEAAWMTEMLLSHLLAFVLFLSWLRHLRVRWFAALFGASVFAFCSLAFVYSCQPSMLWCYAVMPGLFLLVDCIIERRRAWIPAAVAAFALLFLSGHPPIIVYIGFIVGVYVLFRIVECRIQGMSIGECFERIGILVAVVILAVVLASPQLLAMWEQLGISGRTTGVSDLVASSNTLHLGWKWFMYAVFPFPYRLWTPQYWVENIHYPLLVGFLALVGCFARQRTNKFLGFMAILVIGMAFGPHLPLWRMFHSFPIVNQFRFPFRWLFFLPLFVSALAAYGADYITDKLCDEAPQRFHERYIRIVVVCFWGFVAFAAAFCIHKWTFFVQHVQTMFEQSKTLAGVSVLCAILMVACISLFAFGRYRLVALRCGVVLCVVWMLGVNALSVLDLGILIRFPSSFGGQMASSGKAPTDVPMYRTALKGGLYRNWLNQPSLLGVVPNMCALYGISSVHPYCSFIPRWSLDISECVTQALSRQDWDAVLKVASIDVVLSDEDTRRPFDFIPPLTSSGLGTIGIYRNREAIPRIHLASNAVIVSTEGEALRMIKDGFDVAGSVLIQGPASGLGEGFKTSHESAERQSTLEVLDDRPDRICVRLTPQLLRDAYLVVADTYYPGWQATVDGRPVQVFRANHAFRCVPLSAGASHVVLTFSPLVPDWALSLPSFAIVLLFVLSGAAHLRLKSRAGIEPGSLPG